MDSDASEEIVIEEMLDNVFYEEVVMLGPETPADTTMDTDVHDEQSNDIEIEVLCMNEDDSRNTNEFNVQAQHSSDVDSNSNSGDSIINGDDDKKVEIFVPCGEVEANNISATAEDTKITENNDGSGNTKNDLNEMAVDTEQLKKAKAVEPTTGSVKNNSPQVETENVLPNPQAAVSSSPPADTSVSSSSTTTTTPSETTTVTASMSSADEIQTIKDVTTPATYSKRSTPKGKSPPQHVTSTSLSTSNVDEPTVSVERTVNLLNNNKILIKSVKSNISTTPVLPTSAASEAADNDVEITSVTPVAVASEAGKSIEIDAITINSVAAIANTSDISSNKVKTAPKIKREFEQLQKTVNESKVLMQYVLDQKTRGRREKKSYKLKGSALDNEETESNSSYTRSRSRSTTRIESPMDRRRSISKESDRSFGGSNRSTRSQNADFSSKQIKFLQTLRKKDVSGDESNESEPDEDDSEDYTYDGNEISYDTSYRTTTSDDTKAFVSEALKTIPKDGYDKFCWRCHQGDSLVPCSICIRSYHTACVKLKQTNKQELLAWVCPECISLRAAEDLQKNRKFDFDQLKVMLRFAMNRLILGNAAKFFRTPVDVTAYPDYENLIVNPVHLDQVLDNIEASKYSTTEAFVNEFKWIIHNATIYFSQNYKIMGAAKTLLKVCKQEIYDIETCHECYLNANTEKENWFVEVCSKPHLILWAKLKGFPYWPAKAMAYTNEKGVDVRFFGDHDRAFVPAKDCFLYSQSDPNPPTNKHKRNTIADCVKEVDIYIQKLTEKFGSFKYAELRTPYNPNTEDQQLVAMIPGLNRRKISNSANKSDLTLKIVKSADNHLSVVNLTPIANDTDTSGEMKSLNSVESGVTSKGRKTKSTYKTINRANESLPESNAKSKTYQVYRRSSMIAERGDSKKVQSFILKRKSVHANNYEEVLKLDNDDEPPANKKGKHPIPVVIKKILKSKPTPDSTSPVRGYASSDSREANGQFNVGDETETDGSHQSNRVPKNNGNDNPTSSAVKGTRSSSRRKKSLYADVEIVDLDKSTESLMTNTNESPNTEINTNRSILLSSRNQKDKEITLSDSNDEKDNARGLKYQKTDSIGLSIQTLNFSKALSPLRVRPFIEIKQEKLDDTVIPDSCKTGPKNAASPIKCYTDVNGHLRNTGSQDIQVNDSISGNVITIKTEVESDDENRIIVDDDMASDKFVENDIGQVPESISQLLSHIKDGGITVQDRNKLTNTSKNRNDVQPPITLSRIVNKLPQTSNQIAASLTIEQRARKSFPRSSSLQSLSNQVPNGLNKNTQSRSPSNMVYIPIENTDLSLINSINLNDSLKSVNPPPLVLVSSSNNLNNASNIASISTTTTSDAQNTIISNTPTIVGVSGHSSGPPPLAITSLPTSSTTPRSTPRQNSRNSPSTPTHMLSDIVSDNLASAVTDILVRQPPKLTSRPSGPMRSDGDVLFPTEAGNVSKLLMDNAYKMADFFRSVLEDTLSDMSANSNLEARTKLLELEIEKLKLAHSKEVGDLKGNTDKLLAEMRISMEKERSRMINEVRKQCELDRVRIVEETKKKQWCINCGKEAQFYCCWNTSYCDYPCQQQHWTRHMGTCAQADSNQSMLKNQSRVTPPPPVVHQQQSSAQPPQLPQQRQQHGSLPHHTIQQQQKQQLKKDVPQLNSTLSKALTRNTAVQRNIMPRNNAHIQRMVPTMLTHNQNQPQPMYAINVLQRQSEWEALKLAQSKMVASNSSGMINALSSPKLIVSSSTSYPSQRIYPIVSTLPPSSSSLNMSHKTVQKRTGME